MNAPIMQIAFWGSLFIIFIAQTSTFVNYRCKYTKFRAKLAIFADDLICFMKKILFLHGFYASGQCVPAMALREAFAGRAEVITPDLPMHPKVAVRFIRELIDREQPDLLIGNSCGAFYAQMVAPVAGIPALLGNPHFRMTEFLKQRIGEHQYKSPRKDGNQNFVIDEQLIAEFADMETIQFDNCRPDYKDRIWGLFGEQDTLAHFEPLFLHHYNRSFHFPGAHTPTAEQVRDWYVPLAEKMLAIVPPRSLINEGR